MFTATRRASSRVIRWRCRRSKRLTSKEAKRIASNIAKLPDLEVAERLPVGVAQYQALTTHFLD
jgi:hypothetical protein